jgi:kynureninase
MQYIAFAPFRNHRRDKVSLGPLGAACCWLTVWAMDFATAPISPTVSLMPWMQPTASSVALGLKGLTRADLVTPFGDGAPHDNFLAFRTPHAGAIEAALAGADVHADHRGDRMRFGFGLATTLEDVDVAIERMVDVLPRPDVTESAPHANRPPDRD